MNNQPVNVFVSYSHADESIVSPVVNLLRVNKSLVFLDADRITPGKRWREQITKALAECNLVVVFWCDHSSRSTEVASEWRSAIEQDKDLLPLLLDSTPLPDDLAEFQWIDFRGAVGTNHSAIIESPMCSEQESLPKRRMNWYVGTIVSTIIMIGVLGGVSWLNPKESTVLRPPVPMESTKPIEPVQPIEQVNPAVKPTAPDVEVSAAPPVTEVTAAPSPEAMPEFAFDNIGWIALLSASALAVCAYVFWKRRRRNKVQRPSTALRPGFKKWQSPGIIERQIADTLEVEILRRANSGRQRKKRSEASES